jgi:hypothetical protein
MDLLDGLRYEGKWRPYMALNIIPLIGFFSLDDCIEIYHSYIKHGLDESFSPVFLNTGGDIFYKIK